MGRIYIYMHHSYGTEPHLSKKANKLLNVLCRKQQAGNIHVCNLETDKFIKRYKSLSGPIHFETFSIFYLWTKKIKLQVHLYMYIYICKFKLSSFYNQ